MRKFGYILLIFGFLWLAVWCEMSVGSLLRSIAIENYAKYENPPTKMYSRDEVCNAIHSALTEYRLNAHGVILPGTLMFLGGILLDVAGRRNEKRLDDKPSA